MNSNFSIYAELIARFILKLEPAVMVIGVLEFTTSQPSVKHYVFRIFMSTLRMLPKQLMELQFQVL